ncbi:MAG TPA: NUDIX hydrolase [Deltaproteobacteria bacterium]|nr:NUDIX hydrolase [Deltaproteobacteria bacterium]HOI08344.1 NUDIX hydrolase [Deltaproteobacteria bacterium]
MERYWKYLHSRSVYENRIMKVREDAYHFSRGDIVQDFTVLEFPGWVNIIPVTAEGEVVMIRQYRHGVRRVTLEIPGGLISGADTDPAEAAVREMEEETGFVSSDVVHIGTVEPNPAIQSNLCHSFLARNARPGSSQNLDPTEAIAVELVKLEEAYRMLRDGRITHGLVVAAFAFLMLHEGFNRIERS